MDVSLEGGLGPHSLADGTVVLSPGYCTVQILFPVEQAVEPKDNGQGARGLSLVWLGVGTAWLCSFFPFLVLMCFHVFPYVFVLRRLHCGTGLISDHAETAIEVSVRVES